MRLHISLLLYCFVFVSCFAQEQPKYNNYKKMEISEELYFDDDWSDIVKPDEHMYLYYTVDSLDDYRYITDYLYILKDNKGQEFVVGGFNMDIGFFGSNKVVMKIQRKSAKADSWKKYLKGIAMDLLDDPFTISGVAVNDKGELYQTEVMELFFVNSET